MSTMTELERQARFMRNAGQREFDNFYATFSAYTATTVNSLITATGDLTVAQGRAQQCVALMRMFEGVKNG